MQTNKELKTTGKMPYEAPVTEVYSVLAEAGFAASGAHEDFTEEEYDW